VGCPEIDVARSATIDLLLHFFRRNDEAYKTFVFTSVDRDEVFVCVKMHWDAAIDHADESDHLLQLDEYAVATVLNIRLSSGPTNPAFLPFRKAMLEKRMIRSHEWEEDAGPMGTRRRCVLRKRDVINLLYDKVTDVIDVDAMMQAKLLLSYFPLHSPAALKRLIRTWARVRYWTRLDQPIDEIQAYFGSQIALYFVFVGFLCQSMVYLVGAALAMFVFEMYRRGPIGACIDFAFGNADSDARICLAFMTIVWTQVFLACLKRKVNHYLNLWGDDVEHSSTVKERENDRFRGKLGRSEADENRLVMQVTHRERRLGRYLSGMCTFAFILITLLFVALIFWYGARLDAEGYSWAFDAAAYAVSAQIKIVKLLWDTVSWTLVDMEHHEMASDYYNSLGFKSFVFQFINAFAAFFYVAFAMQFIEKCPSSVPGGPGDCWGYLCKEMAVTFIIYCAFTLYDIFFSLISMSLRLWSEKRELAKRLGPDEAAPELSFIEQQAKMDEYDGAAMAEDYIQIILPLAFVLLLGITSPLCSVLALAVFLLQIRADAFKLTRAHRRPFPNRVHPKQRGGGLGVWMEVLDVLGFLAVYTNVALIAFNLPPFTSWGIMKQLVVFFSLCCLVNLSNVIVRLVVPEVGSQVELAKMRHERQREVASLIIAGQEFADGNGVSCGSSRSRRVNNASPGSSRQVSQSTLGLRARWGGSYYALDTMHAGHRCFLRTMVK